MKILAGLTVILFVQASVCFAQVMVPSQIKEVTLFSNQALVHRESKAKIRKGLNELLLEIQAYSVDRDSVSAKVFGVGEILGVQVKKVFLKESPRENIKALEHKIKLLEKSKRIILDEKHVLINQQKFLDSVVEFSQAQIPQDMKTRFPETEALEEMITFLSTNFRSISEKKQSLDGQTEEIDEEIERLRKELASLRSPQEKERQVIQVLFNAEKEEQTISIEASYLVQNASWQPFYKVDVPPGLEGADLTMFCRVKQKTGEDWEDVVLSLSNVIPLKGVGLPTPRSWILDAERARQKVGGLSSDKLSRGRLVEEMEAPAPKDEAGLVQAKKKELPLSFEYEMPQPLDIASEDKETLLPLFSKRLQGEFFYFAVPRVNALTFLVCRARADKELLDGPLNVYLGGRFIGKTFLREKRAAEPFTMSLGADREVKVKREKIRDQIKETFFGKIERKTVMREMAFKITLENIKERPIKIKMLDSVPISRTDKIEVKDLRVSPEPVEKDYQDRQGVYLWDFELDPGAKQVVNIEFVATYPKDLPVFGL